MGNCSKTTAAIALLFLFAVSCAGAKPPTPTPTVIPSTPTPAAKPQPAAEAPPPSQEVLVSGLPDTLASNTEPDKAINIEFILDASGSMLNNIGGKTKLQIAKDVMANLVSKIPTNMNLGLRVYGHRYPQSDKARSCEDIQLLTPLGQGNARTLAQQFQNIKGVGFTPLARSLELAAQDMSARPQSINNIVLLSDGQETCDGKPIDVARQIKEGPGRLTVHTVGFAIDEDTRKELQEMASVSGGTYNEANDDQSLLEAMDRALLAARSGTFLRGEVTGEDGRRVSTSVWLQDPETKAKLHEFRTWIDSPVAPGLYDILVGTAPRVFYGRVRIQEYTRTAIRLDTGGLRVEMADPQGQPVKALAHLKDRATGTVLRSFPTGYNQPALPGSYDLLIEANPTVVRRNISIAARKLTVVGMGRGSLRLDITSLGGGRPNWETELRDPDTDQVIYRSLIGREQPVIAGDYKLVILATPEIRQDIKISSGESRVIRMETGLLRLELLDKSGQRAKAAASLADGSQKEIGRFSTWEDVSPLPGKYQLTVYAQPEIRQQIEVSGRDPTILRLRSP